MVEGVAGIEGIGSCSLFAAIQSHICSLDRLPLADRQLNADHRDPDHRDPDHPDNDADDPITHLFS